MKSDEGTHVSFRVVGFDGSLDKITTILGIDPDQCWTKGEPIGEQGGVHTHSRWAIVRPISMEDSLESQLSVLLDLLEARADAVRSVAANYEAGICIYGYVCESTHLEAFLTPETLARLAGWDLSLDFDFYAI